MVAHVRAARCKYEVFLIRKGLVVRQWKVALSLAILAAAAAPFVFGTWKQPSTETVWVPLTEDQRAKFSAYEKETSDCRTISNPGEYGTALCRVTVDMLKEGGLFEIVSLRSKYWTENLLAALAALFGIFASVMVLPSIARIYLAWLNR
jgi:hypothetical protein